MISTPKKQKSRGLAGLKLRGFDYFNYDYAKPSQGKPLSVNWEIAVCPWDQEHLLARIGLQTEPIAAKRVPPRNLVFLLDVSGSMRSPDKVPLLKRAMGLLVDHLRPEDRVSIVVYAGAAGTVLPPTSGENLPAIRNAIADLEPGGSTKDAGDMGAGHSVTALYELVPAELRAGTKARQGRTLRYQRARTLEPAVRDEWMTVAVRYKAPDSDTSKRFEVHMAGRPKVPRDASEDLRFAAAVAIYGMVLRDSSHRGQASLALAKRLAKGARGSDEKGYRGAFIGLLEATALLEPPLTHPR